MFSLFDIETGKIVATKETYDSLLQFAMFQLGLSFEVLETNYQVIEHD